MLPSSPSADISKYRFFRLPSIWTAVFFYRRSAFGPYFFGQLNRNEGVPRRSPAQRVLWGKEEQRNGRAFLAGEGSEGCGVCDDARLHVVLPEFLSGLRAAPAGRLASETPRCGSVSKG